MRKLKEVNPELIGKNPFTASLKIKVNSVTDINKFTTDEEMIHHPVNYLMEHIQHTKMFHEPGVKDAVCNLSPGAQRLYLWILYRVDPNTDYFQLNKDVYMAKNGIKSPKTYAEACKELSRYGFIAFSAIKGVFWLNPQYYYNGNRVKMYKNNLEIRQLF